MKHSLVIAAVLFAAVVSTAGEIDIRGNFKPAAKANSAPVGWVLTSSRSGTMEVVNTPEGCSVMLSADEGANKSIGIYSAAIPAAKGDKISLRATVTGAEITFALYQYGGKKTSVQKKLLQADAENPRELTHTFTVTDAKGEDVTTVRVAFLVANGSGAVVSRAGASIEK